MADFDLGKAALENQKRLLNAVSPYLEKPLRSPERAALDAAVKGLLVMSRYPGDLGSLGGERLDRLLALMREVSLATLDRIKQILPEAVP